MARNHCPASGLTSQDSPIGEARTPAASLTPLAKAAVSLPISKMADVSHVTAAKRAEWDVAFPRCSVKGCIFPAASARGTLCLIHDLTEREPKHFLSVQPSTMCLDRAKYGVAESEYDDSRARDRRTLALQMDRFRNEVA